jgi:hypothetical protein
MAEGVIMSTLTIRIPESKHARLRSLAKAKGVSLNRLIDEFAPVALTEYDSEIRFRALAARGSKKVALGLLDNLDHAFAVRPRVRQEPNRERVGFAATGAWNFSESCSCGSSNLRLAAHRSEKLAVRARLAELIQQQFHRFHRR